MQPKPVEEGPAKCSFTPFILMLALGVHSLFEGIALGIMTNLNSAINLIISVLIHKFAESMSISIALNKSFSNPNTVFWLMFMYSFVTPLGTTIGILLGDASTIV
jgi:zinc transporter 1/2/3